MPRRFQASYPPEFRDEAVRLVQMSRRPIPEVAAELGINDQTLRNWVFAARADGDEPEQSTGDDQAEVARLRRRVKVLEDRPLGHVEFPYVFDATYLKARVNGRVVSKAVVIATGVTRDCDREVLGLAVGDSEDGAFWTAFLRSLRAEDCPASSWSSPTTTWGSRPPSPQCSPTPLGRDVVCTS
jgi:transposase-like protein